MSFARSCFAVLILFFTGASSCSPDPLPKDCGSFSFAPRVDANETGQAALFQLNFTHTAGSCPIRCGNYTFVQALHPLDLDTGKFIQPHDTQQERTVSGRDDEYFNGWAIDREEGRGLGWYGVTDDFKLKPASGIPGEEFSFGLGASPAKMHDTLARGDRWEGKRMQIIGLTAAVGLDPGTVCENKVLGMLKWMVVFGQDEERGIQTVALPVRLDANQKDMDAFLAAVDEWNNHLDDERVRLPWANADSRFSQP